MKKIFLGLTILTVALISSSCTKTYYQVCTTKPVDPSLFDAKSENYSYEDENIKIEYNMWALRGDRSFSVYNKTDEYLYISDGSSCFSSTLPDSEGEWTKGSMDNCGIVAPHTWRLITSPTEQLNAYTPVTYIPITKSIFLSEGLKEKVRHSESKTFTQETTPLTFTLHVTYYFCSNSSRVGRTIPMSFYVDRVTNYSEKDYLKMKGRYVEKYDVLEDGKWVKDKGYRALPVNRKGFYSTYTK